MMNYYILVSDTVTEDIVLKNLNHWIKSILEDSVLLNFHSTLLKLNYTVT
jgi:hypothetical protein